MQHKLNRRTLIKVALATSIAPGIVSPALAKQKPKNAKAKSVSLSELRKKHGLPAIVFVQGPHDTTQNLGSGPLEYSEILVDGVRRMGQPDPVQSADAWHIGSITKSMTATLAARLVEAKKIGWDDRITDHIKTLPDVAAMDSAYADVKLHQILMHRGGFPANLPMMEFARYRLDNSPLPEQRARFANQALALEPVGPAGSTFLYSNTGYVVAAAMIEAATGESWENLIRKYVFDPIGISPEFGPPPKIWGHRRGNDADKPIPVAPSLFADNPAVMAPAGAVHIMPSDMMVYLHAHAKRSAFLSAENWDRLHTPYPGGKYAMGWVVWPNGRRTHNGSNTLWYAECGFDPATGKTAFFATNDGYLPAASAAALSALSKL